MSITGVRDVDDVPAADTGAHSTDLPPNMSMSTVIHHDDDVVDDDDMLIY